MKWWEKTVEYSFVVQAANKNIFNLLLPLDGDVESIGDAVLGKDSEFFVIEFKKDLSDLSGEYSKYLNGKSGFLAASEEMIKNPSSRAHFIIGGKFSERQPFLSLEARRYFDVNGTPVNDITDLFHDGMNFEQLNKYTKQITLYKKTEKEDEKRGSSSGSFSFENVLAVSKSKNEATLIPLHYFKGPTLKKELNKTREYDSPSPL